MLQDLPENNVRDVGIAVVLENADPITQEWAVYLINMKDHPINTVLVSSKGYGTKDGKKVKTSILRHSLGDIPAKDFILIEHIKEELFGLTNEYWLSFYEEGNIFDKKFIFVTESISEDNLIKVPLIAKPGVLIFN